MGMYDHLYVDYPLNMLVPDAPPGFPDLTKLVYQTKSLQDRCNMDFFRFREDGLLLKVGEFSDEDDRNEEQHRHTKGGWLWAEFKGECYFYSHLDPKTSEGWVSFVAYFRDGKLSAIRLDRIDLPESMKLGPAEKARGVEVIQCVQIDATDWLKIPLVRAWVENPDNCVPRLFTGDIFTIWDHGEGPHSPESSPESAMPQWLWDEIGKTLKEKDIGYAVVRLMNYD